MIVKIIMNVQVCQCLHKLVEIWKGILGRQVTESTKKCEIKQKWHKIKVGGCKFAEAAMLWLWCYYRHFHMEKQFFFNVFERLVYTFVSLHIFLLKIL